MGFLVFWRKRKNLLVLLFYTLFSLIILRNLVFNISTHLPGWDDKVKTGNSLWHYWFNNYLVTGKADFLQNDWRFYPENTNMSMDINEFGNWLITLPFQWLGLVTATNILVLISIVLTAFGTYLLVKSIIERAWIAMFAGLIFAFSPVIINHFGSGWLNLALIWPVPFHFHFLHLAVRENSFRKAIISGLFLSMLVFNYLVHFAVFLPLSLLFSAYLLTEGFSVERCKKLALVYLTTLLICSPLFWQIAKARSYIPSEVPLSIQDYWAPSVEYFFKPPKFNLILGKNYINDTQESETSMYIGMSAVLIMILALLSLVKKVDKTMRLWFFCGVFFFLLSLGPLLHINRQSLFRVGDIQTNFPLPFMIYQAVPLLGGIQEPGRFVYPFMLCLTVVASMVLAKMWQNKLFISKIVVIGVITLFSVEYLAINFPSFEVHVPEFYSTIAKDKRDFVVMDVPMGRSSGNAGLGEEISIFAYYQTIHGKKVPSGYAGRLPGWVVTRLETDPLFLYITSVQQDLCRGKSNPELAKYLDSHNVGYVFIYRRYIKQKIIPECIQTDGELVDISKTPDLWVLKNPRIVND